MHAPGPRWLAKISYIINLFLGVAIITFTVFRERIDADSSSVAGKHASSIGIIVISALLTTLAGFDAFYSPAQRHRELRSVVENVQSSTFRFRTRTGAFATKLDDPRSAEKCMLARLREVRADQSFSMGESSFQRNYSPDIFTHGQNSKMDPAEFRKQCEKTKEGLSMDVRLIANLEDTVPDNHFP